MIYRIVLIRIIILLILSSIPAYVYAQHDSLATKYRSSELVKPEAAAKASEYFSKAIELANKYKYTEAENYFDKCIAIDHKSYEPYFNRGVCKTHLHDYESAILDFNKSMDLYRTGPFMFALYFRGYCYNKLSHFDLAISDLTSAIDMGTSADIWAERGY